ncbi:Protein M3 [Phlyctochytrium planicorne]|nr:Protein M3 [Phlyctochytrium planicorne]
MSSRHRGCHVQKTHSYTRRFQNLGHGLALIRKCSKILTPFALQVLIWVLYPSLLFTKVIMGIDVSNIAQFGIMSAASVFMLTLGLVIGYVVLKVTNPPIGFRYGTMLAVAMGNHGDLPIAIVLSLGDSPPFAHGDAAKGVAYISGFLCLTNLFFFSIGYKLFGEDFRDTNTTSPIPSMMDISHPATINHPASGGIVASSTMDSPTNLSASPSTNNNNSIAMPSPSTTGAGHPAAMALTRASSFKFGGGKGLIRRESFSMTSRMADAGWDGSQDERNSGGVRDRAELKDGLGSAPELVRQVSQKEGLGRQISLKDLGPKQSSQNDLGKGSSVVLSVDNVEFGSNSPLDASDDKARRQTGVGWFIRQTTTSPAKAKFGNAPTTKISEETWFWIKAFGNLANIATIAGLIIAVTPPLRQLFVLPTNATGGESEPPFQFIFETLKFLGDAAVPIGLVNLGAALGRLNVKSLLPIRITLAIAFARLVLFPVIGIAIVVGLVSAKAIDPEDKILRFVLMIETCVPTASSTVFFTQLWHPRGEADNIASVVLIEYSIAAFTMIVCLTISLSLVS